MEQFSESVDRKLGVSKLDMKVELSIFTASKVL
jgi:hypothetical protein